MHDTIVAIATPSGKSAIAVIRLSGNNSLNIVKRIISDPDFDIKPWTIRQCNIIDTAKSILIDEVIISYMKSPKSYTGEDIIEVYCHGGKVIIQTIYDLLIENGAIPAKPGEFTKRAFLNNKIDLIKAEAINEIVNVKNKNELYTSVNNLFGFLSNQIKDLISDLITVKTNIEYQISFQDDSKEETTDIIKGIKETLDKVNNILDKSSNRRYKEGMQVCIIGKSNVGKSSLFNSLLGWERMVVSPYPSTTHDFVEEIIDICGFEIKLIDTAGSVKDPNALDEIFSKITEKLVRDSSLLLLVIDLSDYSELDEKILKKYINENILILFNKSDLKSNIPEEFMKLIPDDKEYYLISTYISSNIQEIKQRILKEAKKYYEKIDEYYINERQQGVFKNIKKILLGIIDSNKDEIYLDLISKDIDKILELLEAEIGTKMNDKVLDNIFKNFCIGK